MARNRKRPSSVKSFKDAWAETGLPTPEEVEQAAAELVEAPKKESRPPTKVKATPKPKSPPKTTKSKTMKKTAQTAKRFTLADAQEQEKEPVNEKGRARFNTTIKPELRDMLQRIAKNNGLTVSDVLEEILIDYFGIKK